MIRPKLEGLDFKRISVNQRAWLEHPFEEDEIKNVVWNIEDDKAPGPDAFSMAFLKVCWEVVRKDIMDSMHNFYQESFLDKGSNATFISLILKMEHAYRILDFRSISLVGNIYKILSKSLACRLKEVLKDIISPNQCAFLGGRQVVDCVLIANECINAMMKRGESGMKREESKILCKLDLEKAYNRVN